IENTDLKSQNAVLKRDNEVFKSKKEGLERDNEALKSQTIIFEKDNENFKKYTDLLTKNAMDEETIKKLKKEIKETIDEKDKVENDLLKIIKEQKEEIKAMNELIVKLNAEKLE
ncbi:13113_t:CDS:2, partial [Gigaspora margarita]